MQLKLQLKSEKIIQDEVMRFLATDNRVATAMRVSNGRIATGYMSVRHIKNGRIPLDMCKVCDIEGMMNDGRRLVIEVKKGGWKPPKLKSGDPLLDAIEIYAERTNPPKNLQKPQSGREHELFQWAIINECIRYGGVAGFATSLEEVDFLLGIN